MDTTVQSTSKCASSDFSIERILSDDGRNKEESGDSPSWLCCTRYRPPRLPRAVNSSICRSRRSGRHARVPFTAAQAAALEAAYARAPYLAPPALRALAAALQLRDDRIKIWFQNRRARERREKCANIVPPAAVTLPPTAVQRPTILHQSWIERHIYLQNQINTDNSPSTVLCDTNDLQVCSLNSSCSDEERSESPLDVETLEP
ncbi:hypothetical protein K1T71_010871 [Dendrolimus kikuchii]|uniref:Uncharacterized protein n=1 Tax=Dendrolimus kikuchii TaxID=765133 RepID=A0ACC1CQF2_9NEOP|nr:hypothetical protein K1T71_010871 [Dendrolimus kikuchii]